MTKRPILFSAPMVRALLDGSKTQTRRVLKLPNGHRWDELQGGEASGNIETDKWPGTWHASEFRCPYGQPGDQLWVKETHWRDDEDGAILYAADPDDFAIVHQNRLETDSPRYNWKPSIFMRREYSRITLEITDVRVERLHEISRGDAMAEGCPFPNMAMGDDPRKWYADLWNAINGTGSWDKNPWVWVVEFTRHNDGVDHE